MDVCGAYRHNVEYKPSQEGHGGDPGNVPGDEIEGVSRRGAEVGGEDSSLRAGGACKRAKPGGLGLV